MTPKVIKVTPLPNYTLDVIFSDGRSGQISVKALLFGPVFEPLKDTSLFKQVSIDDFGVICWPNNADLASEYVYENLHVNE